MVKHVQERRELKLDYHPVIWRFMQSDARVRVVVGPIGSGKSTGVGCGEIIRRAFMQNPSPVDNIRYFKALIVRNTRPELKKTTLKTWLEWNPEHIGKFNYTDLTHHITVKPGKKKPGMDLLVEFMGLDKPGDAKKLLSWEGTIIWFNEAKEINLDNFTIATTRTGRYPGDYHGGATWHGTILDTNPYYSGHWLDKFEKNPPRGYEFFRQPPAVLEMEKTENGWESKESNYPLTVTNKDYIHSAGGSEWAVNPKAENLPYTSVTNKEENRYLSGAYYTDLIVGKNKQYIRIYVQGKTGSLTGSHVVIPEFDTGTMIRNDAVFDPGLPLLCGLDFGAGTLYPAAVFGQLDPVHNVWRILKEVIGIQMAVFEYADMLIQEMETAFPNRKSLFMWGDPAGMQRDGTLKKTYFDLMQLKGLHIQVAPTNDIDVRKECVKNPMLRFSQGKPSFLISPKCRVLIEALTEKWHYPKIQEGYSDKPSKNHPHSDVGEALAYLLSGGGEFNLVTNQISQDSFKEGWVMKTDWNPFEV